MKTGSVRIRLSHVFVSVTAIVALIGMVFRAAALEIEKAAFEGRAWQVEWTAETGTLYALQRCDSLTTGTWISIVGLCPNVTNAQLRDIDASDASSRFYRLAARTNAAPAGESAITYLAVPAIGGDVAVRIATPHTPRYSNECAGVVLTVDSFLTPPAGLDMDIDFTAIGLIHLTYLWPGQTDKIGVSSDGAYDYGGAISLAGLQAAILFANGTKADRFGRRLDELVQVKPLPGQMGLYAFSHPGMAAVNVLANNPGDMTNVAWFVGRENPASDQLTALEVGYMQTDPYLSVTNPLYCYPDHYTPTNILLDYSLARWSWDNDRPYFDLNTNGTFDASDHLLGSRVPKLNAVRQYSAALLNALEANGSLTNGPSWPENLALPSDAQTDWNLRSCVHRYADLSPLAGSLRVMLVFAKEDHAQGARDKPHIHQAWDGFKFGAGLDWIRLNPDQAYMTWARSDLGAVSPDNPANAEPADWRNVVHWAFPNIGGNEGLYAAYAGVAEMADRSYSANWTHNLTNVLADYPSP